MVLLATFKVLLLRYTNQEDITVGSPVANRSLDFERTIGLFANTVALRSNLAGNPAFTALLEQVRESTLAAYGHQELPFDDLVDELHPDRSLSHTPVVQVMFALQNATADPLTLAGITLTPQPTDTGTAQLDMTWELKESDAGLDGVVDFRRDLFDLPFIEQMVGHFGNLLESIREDPSRRLSELRLLSRRPPALRRQAPVAAVSVPPAGTLLHREFAGQALLTPDAIAVVCGDVHLSYRAIDRAADALARALVDADVRPDELVGLCLDRPQNLVAGILGILKAGGAYVPLDPTYPDDSLSFIVSDARLRVVVTDPGSADRLSWLRCTFVNAEEPGATPPAPAAAQRPGNIGPLNLCYAMYTSGSTGRPKGVMISHRNVLRLFASTERLYEFDESDIWTCAHSFAFDFSVWEIWGALLHGGRLVIVPSEIRRSFDALRDLLLRERVSVLSQTPSAFQQLLVADRLRANPRWPCAM